MRVLALCLPLLALTGCYTVAKTAVDVAVLPVKAVAKGVDLATTSQSEADEKRGREQRKMLERCRKGKPRPEDACPQVPH